LLLVALNELKRMTRKNTSRIRRSGIYDQTEGAMKLSRAAAMLAVMLVVPSVAAVAQGQRIAAKDGDVVIVDGGSRIRIVRRSPATVRTIYNPAQRWLVILADLAAANGAGDGRVDVSYTFNEIAEWPAGERWEGRATFDEYFVAGEIGNFGLGLGLPSGLVQLLDTRSAPLFKDAAAVAVIDFRGSGRGGGGGQQFDAAEQAQVAAAMRGAETRANLPDAMRGFSSSVGLSINGAPPAAVQGGPPPAIGGPVRVGGNIKPPVKIADAAPVLPEAARQAGIRGVVILEITIAADGSIKDAKVLRSIPLLDQAALDTVRQWRYEPTLLNGTPVPVILTVTVNFQ
jgi:TonB family protein